jgi:hypothetical protein
MNWKPAVNSNAIRGWKLRSTIIGVSFLLFGCSPDANGPLSLRSPTGWKIEHKKSGRLHSYSMAAQVPSGGILEFSEWPVPGQTEEIPTLVRQVVDIFLQEAKTSSEFTLASEEYRIERFTGEACQGSCATFQMGGDATNTLLVIFMMSVGDKLWQGQFTGSLEAWNQAHTALKSARKRD